MELKKKFPLLSKTQIDKFLLFEKLIKNWNKKVNLISRKDIEFLFERHISYSLSITFFFKFKTATKILDVGTGGGFPGIPLAIFFPNVEFTLIDRTKKKIKVIKLREHKEGNFYLNNSKLMKKIRIKNTLDELRTDCMNLSKKLFN